jgi:predicted permease
VLADLRLAARALARTPAATAVAVITLALGVGANAALLGLVDRLLLRPTPGVADPARVVRVYGRGGWTAPTRSYGDYLDLRGAPGRRGVRALADVAAYQSAPAVVRRPVRTEVRIERVTPTYLTLLGARPVAGRDLTPADVPAADGAVAERVAVVSAALGERLTGGGAAAALGQTLVIGRETYRVIGVAPPRFRGADATAPADLWTPLAPLPADRGNYGAVHVVARLAPGVALAAADREANRLNGVGYAADGVPHTEDVMRLGPLSVTQGPAAPREVRVAAWLAAVAGLVLLIATANVAHLLLARGLARRGDAAVRAALGATRGRLARHALGEGVVLGALAGAAALAVVAAVAPVLARAVPGGWGGAAPASGFRAYLLETLGDGRAVALVAALGGLAGLACGALPALAAWRQDVAGALAGLTAGRTGQRREARRRAALLATQVGLTAALLVGAGLFARSLAGVRGLPLGLDVDRIVVLRVDAQDAGLSEAGVDSLLGRLADRVRAVPGAAVVSRAHTVPFESGWRTRFFVPGRDPERWGAEGGGRFNFLSTFVGPEYREAVGLPLLAGRWIAPTDRAGAPPVAVVNDAFARAVWPGTPPAAVLGRCLRLMAPGAECTQVVGVVRAARSETIFETPPEQYYLALDQPRRAEGATALLVRARGAGPSAAARLAGDARAALQPLVPEGVDVVARPLAAAVDPVRRPWELGAAVFAAFGVLALVVAGAGLYGVVTLLVAERTRELGIRRALGAGRADVVRLVGRGVAAPVAIGVAAGLALGAGGARAAAGLLYGVGPLDPAAYLGAVAVLGAAAALAAAGPLRRAGRVDPAVALRLG